MNKLCLPLRFTTMTAMKLSLPIVALIALLCPACDSGGHVMLAPPAEPPEEIAVPPAVVDVPGKPSLAPALDLSEAALSSDATDITIEDEQDRPASTDETRAGALFHVCRSGESLEDAASAQGVDPRELARVNGLPGGGLREGLVLLLPRSLQNVAMAPDVTTYTVVAGDNFSRIARNYHMTTAGLMNLNQTESSALQVGDVLYVPNPTQ